MKHSAQSPLIKSILEFGPILIFFIAYRYAPIPSLPDGDEGLERIIFATKVFIPTIFVSLVISWVQTKVIARMPLFTALLVLIFGGLTIWLRDETFIKMKPTILYFLFALILGFGLLRKRSYLKSLMEVALPMKDEGWMILTRRFVGFFVLLAFLNEAVWRLLTTDSWVSFKTFGLPAAMFIFFFAQARLIQKYHISDKNNN
ncbi:MAG: inner membrane-spanning protein YciB [Pseudomonadota bacterium]|nr:inner membrane-spanning protein YciB [Pseudomonadota bacterium]